MSGSTRTAPSRWSTGPEAGGLIGVARIGLGQDFRHVPYHELVPHGAGRIQVDPVTGAGTI
jgi:hypothetical protein